MALAAVPNEGTTGKGERLFDNKPITLHIDPKDPKFITISFSGSVNIDRSDDSGIELLNKFKQGLEHELEVTVRSDKIVNGVKRDKDGWFDGATLGVGLTVIGIDGIAGPAAATDAEGDDDTDAADDEGTPGDGAEGEAGE